MKIIACLRNLRLQHLLTAGIVSLTAVPFFLTFFIVNNHFADRSRQQFRDELNALADIGKTHVMALSARLKDNTNLIANCAMLRDTLVTFESASAQEIQAALQPRLQQANQTVPILANVALYDSKGRFLTSSTGEEIYFPKPASRQPRASIELVPHRDYLSLVSEKPLYHEGQHVGWLRIITREDFMLALQYDHAVLGQTGEWVLALEETAPGSVFFLAMSPRSGSAFTRRIHNPDHTLPMIRALSGHEGIFEEWRDYSGNRVMAATRHIPGHGWAIVAKIDEQEIDGITHGVLIQLFTIEGLLIIFAALLGMWASRRIAGPIEALTEVTHHVAAGDLSQRTSVQGCREARELASAFNTMTASVQDLTDNLQQRVDEQTRELKIANQKLHCLASTDALTGLHNRRHFFDHLNREFKHACRYHQHLSVLLLDIDHFKKVNDEHGHQTGDRALRIFADNLRRAVRDTDIVGRIGGEEFAILLPKTDASSALLLAERICHDVAQQHFLTCNGQPLSITTSIGIASYADDTHSLEVLLSQADMALYESKHAGRNQAHLYQ